MGFFTSLNFAISILERSSQNQCVCVHTSDGRDMPAGDLRFTRNKRRVIRKNGQTGGRTVIDKKAADDSGDLCRYRLLFFT